MKKKSNKKLGFKYKLGIKEYPYNAAKNFTTARIFIYTIVSIVLSILLVITSIGKGYGQMAMFFIGFAFVLVVGYALLNIMALIIKIKNNK